MQHVHGGREFPRRHSLPNHGWNRAWRPRRLTARVPPTRINRENDLPLGCNLLESAEIFFYP
jgi:hypothetical protein